MKGTPDQPQCGFSRAVCQILDIHEVDRKLISAHNVLEDEEIRQGMLTEIKAGAIFAWELRFTFTLANLTNDLS